MRDFGHIYPNGNEAIVVTGRLAPNPKSDLRTFRNEQEMAAAKPATRVRELSAVYASIAYLGTATRPVVISAPTDSCIAARLVKRGLYPRR